MELKLNRTNISGGLRARIKNNKQTQSNSDLLETLKITLPQFFDADGNFKSDKFIAELKSSNQSESRDGYELGFVGKNYARLQVGLESETMIAPDCAHNNLPENKTSKNIFITGDNLDALRHLVNAYENKVKLIYIDPPYNTGKEFIYRDQFVFDDQKLRNALGYSEHEIERLKSIQGKSSHSAWLTFMYPRLKIAQKLLTQEGMICVSIDDNEQANLKLLMDDIFGEGNFVASFIVIRSEGGGLAKHAVIGHDYLLAYAKNIANLVPLAKTKEIRGKIITKNNEEYWIETDWLRKKFSKYGTCEYENIVEFLGQSKKDEIDQGLKDGKYILIKKGDVHIVGRYRKVSEDSSKFYTIMKHLNKDGNTELEKLGLADYFDFPKPVSLCKELILGCTLKNPRNSDLILDFFAGSATTAQAVMQLNSEDGGNRKFILIQLDEPTNHTSKAQKTGYKTIDEIARERIKRAAKKIKTEKNLTSDDFDFGFKHYKLVKPDATTIDKILDFDPNEKNIINNDMITPFAQQKTETSGVDTILTTWLIDDGCCFDVQVEEKNFGKYQAHYVKESLTLYLINQGWNADSLEILVRQIGGNELLVGVIVVYPYSFDFESMRELKANIKNVDNPPIIVERF
ncbi:MAG: site-specific DNA-methyltransferase [Planctomycetaceae bacterium]|jgi:adenine-specific DNA-methyltransferase|nr:site-specific DNA-methyltransferase [Planctomycetaceae bacterium]